jgi:hypothetical protein
MFTDMDLAVVFSTLQKLEESFLLSFMLTMVVMVK